MREKWPDTVGKSARIAAVMRSTTMLPEGVIVPIALRWARYQLRGSLDGRRWTGSGINAHQFVAIAPLAHGEDIVDASGRRSTMNLRSHGRYDFDSLHSRPAGCWPGGARLAFYVALNLEQYSFGDGL